MTRSEAALAIAAGLLAAALALAIVWTVDAAGQTSEGDTSTSPEPGSGQGLDDPRFGEYARHQQELTAEQEDESSGGTTGTEDWPGSEFPWTF